MTMLKAFQVAGLTAALWCLADFFSTAEPEKVKRAPYLSALSKFARPPCCKQWPESIIELIRYDDPDKDFCRIVFSWDKLLDDLRLGRLELCDPEEHLHLLIQNKLKIDGWPFLFKVMRQFRPFISQWERAAMKELCCLSPIGTEGDASVNAVAFVSHLDTHEVSQSSDYHKHLKPVKVEIEQLPLDTWNTHDRCLFYTDWLEAYGEDVVHFWSCIDATTTGLIEVEESIRLTQNFLSVTPIKLSVLDLTVFANPTDRKTVDYCTLLRDEIIYSLSFDSFKFGIYQDPDRMKASSGATFTSLDNVITRLTSGNYSQNILETRDISDEYASWLWGRAKSTQSLIEDNKGYFSKKEQVSYWRKEQLYNVWEAAMYKGGFLKRYLIVMKNDSA